MSDDNQELRDPSGLWPWFRGFMITSALLAVLLGATEVYEIVVGTPSFDGEEIAPEALAWAAISALGGIAYFIVFIVCVVLACRLTYRMMRNLHRLNAPGVATSPGWAVGSYFIPFANLFLPVRAVGQMWRGTHEAAGEAEKDSAIPLWWGAWIVGNILSSVSWNQGVRSGAYSGGEITDMGAYTASLWTGAASSFLGAAAAIFMLMVFAPMVRLQSGVVRAQAFG